MGGRARHDPRLRTATGRAGRVERLGRGTQSHVSAVLGDDRAALVAWGTQRISSIFRSAGPFAAYAAVGPRGRRFGRAQLLERRADDRLVDGRSVRATITAQRASVAYMGSAQDARLTVRSRDVAGRGFGPPQTLSAPSQDARLIDAGALDGRGQVVIWKTGSNVAGAPGALVAASRSAGGAVYGPAETIDPQLPLSVSDVALNPVTGQAWVTWSRDRSIFVAVRPASAYPPIACLGARRGRDRVLV